jgi:hypothetical protein
MIAMLADAGPTDEAAVLAATCRRYVLTMLARDAAYDQNGPSPQAPPVSLLNYRRGLCALVAAEPLPVLEPGRWVEAGEGTAYRVGQQAWQDAMLGAVAQVWRAAAARRMRAGMPHRQLVCWWVPAVQLAAFGSDHAYVRGILAWDVEYDDDPRGVPPLLVHDHRSALVTAMRLEPAGLLTAGRWVSDAEKAAFDDGQRAAYNRAAVVVEQAWRPADGLDSSSGSDGMGAGRHRCAGLCGGRRCAGRPRCAADPRTRRRGGSAAQGAPRTRQPSQIRQ